MDKHFGEQYWRSMLNHPFGYAMYEPPKFALLHPGAVGYLNYYGRWCKIVDLTDAQALETGGYTPFPRVSPDEPDPRHWGPLESGLVKRRTIKLEGDVDAASLGLPVDLGGVVEFSTKVDFGAVLMCDDKVIAEGYDHRGPFVTWMKENAGRILKNHREVRDCGVCAATWTYSSSNIHIQAWSDPERTLRLGFKLGATGAGSAKPEVSWFRSHSGNSWQAFTDDKRVAFFTGVKFRFTMFGPNEVRNNRAFRGEANEFTFRDLDDGGSCQANVESFGMGPDDAYDQDDFEEDQEDERDEDA